MHLLCPRVGFGFLDMDLLPYHAEQGPTGTMAAAAREVWLADPTRIDTRWEERAPTWCFAMHELSHAFWTPPGCGVHATHNALPETLGQDQWEYAVVRAVFPRRFWGIHLRFLNESGRATGRDRDLRSYKDARKLRSWREGLQNTIQLGTLVDARTPTWAPPDYSKLGLVVPPRVDAAALVAYAARVGIRV